MPKPRCAAISIGSQRSVRSGSSLHSTTCPDSTDVQCQEPSVCSSATGFVCTPILDLPDGAPCNDEDDATGADQCVSGACVGQDLCAGVVCMAPECNMPGTCDTQSGECTPALPLPDETMCDDGDPETEDDECALGNCRGVRNIDCATINPAGDPDSCNGQCPAGGACYFDAVTTSCRCTNSECESVSIPLSDETGAAALDLCLGTCGETQGRCGCLEETDGLCVADCTLPGDPQVDGPCPSGKACPDGSACQDDGDGDLLGACYGGLCGASGDCFPGFACTCDPNGCGCLDVQQPPACGDAAAPACSGLCAIGESCADSGSGCTCEPTPCADSDPVCGEACPIGEQCGADGVTGDCVCAPIECEASVPTCVGACPPDSPICGGFCPPNMACMPVPAPTPQLGEDPLDDTCRCIPL